MKESNPSPKKDILKALDEMEQVSQELNAKKARAQDRIQKHVKPKVEPTREEIIRDKIKHQQQSSLWELKTRVTLILSVWAGSEYFLYEKTNGDLVDIVMIHIAVISLYGIYKAKKSQERGGR